MKNYLRKHQHTFLTGLIALALLFYFYADVLLSPNSFLFDAGGDGIKNYYTYLFHAQYDSGFTQFGGMNYPYLEHIVYTDAHPLLSYLIGQLGLANYGVGIMNYLMLLSYPIGAMVLFRILLHYKTDVSWAVGGAVIIAFMSPQVFRMTGHYSMSYVFAIPLMWLLLIKAYNTGKWYWSGAISLYLLGFFFTHPYLGLIMALFGIVFWLVTLILDHKQPIKKRLWRAVFSITIQMVVPILLFQGMISLTDTHLNRLSNPAGFFHYYANWKSILVAHDGPLRRLVYAPLDIRIGVWEAWAYIGFPTIIFALISCFHLIRDYSYKRWKKLIRTELVLFIIAAWLILLFAFCFPFKLDGFRWIADFFGPLKQFRILGRFTWVFYYVITVAAIVGFYKVYMRKNEPFWPILFFISFAFYFLEFAPVHERISQKISQSPNLFNEKNISQDTKEVIQLLEENDYDAFIMLPFQHMSSENIMLLGSEAANKDAFLISYHGHIPMINSISSRMSFSEAIKVNNYFSPPFMEKMLTYDLPSDAKIAVIKNRDALSPAELKMTWESEKIAENSAFVVYDFNPAEWNNEKAYRKIQSRNATARIELSEGWRSDTSDVWFYYNGFDENSVEKVKNGFHSRGALHDFKNSWNTIESLSLDQIPPGDYEVSYWFELTLDRPDQLAVVEAQFANDSTAWLADFDIKQSTVIVDQWCRIEMEFSTTNDMKQINLLIVGNGSEEPFMVDELLIRRPTDPALFKTVNYLGKTKIVFNNYYLENTAFQ